MVKAKRGFQMFKYVGTMRKDQFRHALSVTVRLHTLIIHLLLPLTVVLTLQVASPQHFRKPFFFS